MSDNIQSDAIELLCTKEDFMELMDDNAKLCDDVKRLSTEVSRLEAVIDLVMTYDSNLIDTLTVSGTQPTVSEGQTPAQGGQSNE